MTSRRLMLEVDCGPHSRGVFFTTHSRHQAKSLSIGPLLSPGAGTHSREPVTTLFWDERRNILGDIYD
jgi:hypothetical protein